MYSHTLNQVIEYFDVIIEKENLLFDRKLMVKTFNYYFNALCNRDGNGNVTVNRIQTILPILGTYCYVLIRNKMLGDNSRKEFKFNPTLIKSIQQLNTRNPYAMIMFVKEVVNELKCSVDLVITNLIPLMHYYNSDTFSYYYIDVLAEIKTTLPIHTLLDCDQTLDCSVSTLLDMLVFYLNKDATQQPYLHPVTLNVSDTNSIVYALCK